MPDAYRDKLFDRHWKEDIQTGCHRWDGAKSRDGYGRFWLGTGHVGGGEAHRYAFERKFGPIPDGLVIDHICRTRLCVNPSHLRIVNSKTNTLQNSNSVGAKNAAKTHCIRGHPFDESNTGSVAGKIKRVCKTCDRAKARRKTGGASA